MSNTITWSAPPTPPDHYLLYSADDYLSPFSLLASLTATTYTDVNGTSSSVYKIQAINSAGAIVSDSGAFQARENFAANLTTLVKVDTDYQSINNLRYEYGSTGIPEADVRVYQKPDYDAGRTDVPLFVIQTDATGRLSTPVYLEPGMSYTLVYSKKNAYGPNIKNITV